VSVSRLYAEGSQGQVRSLYDFTCLAKENWNEAYRLFYNKSFANVIKGKEVKEAMIYRGIIGARASQQNMEEFLIGIRKKERISISLDKTSLKIPCVEETMQQSVEIKKNEWGYVSVKIASDADFIRPSETRITTEDFLGSSYTCNFLIDYDRMHAGYNFGQITFTTAYETLSLEIRAHRGEKTMSFRKKERAEILESRAGLVELYEAFRLKKIVTGVWANETIEILNHLHAIVPEEPMYVLLKAQALIINRQRQDAEWILDEFKAEWKNRRSPEWGFYLYLMSLLEREPEYVDRMTREIETIYYENPDSALLFWVLSFLEEEYYNNGASRLKAIKKWVMNGCPSPYLYVEAYYVICQEPYLLEELGEFEIRILHWAARRHSLNREIAEQIFEITEPGPGFDKAHFELLEYAYELVPEPEYLSVICSYLIRAGKFDVCYHHWFEKGIENELRLTSLYEGYLMSMDEREIGTVPRIIQMYFQYDSNLPYKKMAILYNNIIASKESDPELYMQYRSTIGRFAMEHLEQGHMDDNLAVIYEDMLNLGLVNEELAHHLSHIIFTQKLVIFDKHIVRAIIYQRQLKDPQVVPIVDHAAYFQLFSDDYVILFEDAKGRRFVNNVSYRLEALMDYAPYLEKCISLAPDELSYIISYFGNKTNYLTYTAEDEKFFPQLLGSGKLEATYQAQTALEIVRYFGSGEPGEIVTDYLKSADYELMPQQVRQYMLERLIELRMYDRACELVKIYGIDQISSSSRVVLSGYMINRFKDGDEADEFLIDLCVSAFLSRKYNDKILSYLCEFYNGPSEQMLKLWRAAKSFEINTFELEERIMVQMLYADMDLWELSHVFSSYYEAGGRELVVMAYISACAHAFFVDGQRLSTDVLAIIQERFLRRRELNDACKLALFKALSDSGRQDEVTFSILDELLSEYTRRNMNFAFYSRLDRRLVKKYHLYDKVFLEYRTDPRKHVVLHYSRDEDGDSFISEDMPDVYDGIFVVQFVLFFGEDVQYYITEEYGNQTVVTQSSRLATSASGDKNSCSRFELINQMLIAKTLADTEAERRYMKTYAFLDNVTGKVFKLL
jgi:hypothetical protein